MTHKIFISLALGLIGWRIYARFRRSIGRQPFRPVRLSIYAGVFLILSSVFAVRAVGHTPLILGWLCGLLPGGLLGVWALHLTQLETTEAGRFYTPNGRIGLALSLVFVVRIVYRAIMVSAAMTRYGVPSPALGESALTYWVFELLAGYYIIYNAGLVRRFGKEKKPAAGSAG